MNHFIPIKDKNSLDRDLSNNGIINNNHNEYNKYLMRKVAKEKEHCKLETIENEIACLKNDLCKIKELLMNFAK
jgi:hypothetical protein